MSERILNTARQSPNYLTYDDTTGGGENQAFFHLFVVILTFFLTFVFRRAIIEVDRKVNAYGLCRWQSPFTKAKTLVRLARITTAPIRQEPQTRVFEDFF